MGTNRFGGDERAGEHDESTSKLSTRRREYLKLAGTAAVSMAGLSASAGGAAAARVGGVRFDTVVDMVEDAGCDPNGRGSCHDEIMDYADDGTLLKFPEGTYRLDTGPKTHIDLRGYDRFGLAGAGGGATFEFTSGTDGYNDIDVRDGDRFVYRNIDWDITANDCAPGFAVRARNRFVIKDLTVNGRQDNDGGFTLQPGIKNASGTGVIERFDATDGCEIGSVERNGVLVAKGRNNGTLRFIDCHLAQFSNNGIYAAASSGPIQVEGGTFRNSEPAQLRFSGENSYVDGAVVELDISKMPRKYGKEIENARGIWWETKNTDPLHSGGEIRNTEVTMRNAGPPPLERTSPNTSAGILIPSGGVTIRDSTVRMDITPRVAIYAQGPLQSDLPPPYRVVMDNVTVTGEASDWAAVQIEERPNSVIENCEFDIGYRNGIVLAECDGSVVKNTTINSKYGGGRAVVLWGTKAEIRNVDTNNDNPLPDGSKGDEIYGPSPVNGGGGTEPGENTLTIEGTGGRAEYTFTATANVQKSTANAGTINDDDVIRRGYVGSGAVLDGGADSFTFDGSLETLKVFGDAEVSLNGDRLSDAEVEALPNDAIEVEGTGSLVSYVIGATGKTPLQKLTANDATLSNKDKTFRTTANGAVINGSDAYGFDGTIDSLSVGGDANVFVNGMPKNPEKYEDHVVTIVGSGDLTTYDFSVGGRLSKSTANFATTNKNDKSTGSTVSGGVIGGADSYVYNGDLSDLSVDGDATVYIDGRKVN